MHSTKQFLIFLVFVAAASSFSQTNFSILDAVGTNDQLRLSVQSDGASYYHLRRFDSLLTTNETVIELQLGVWGDGSWGAGVVRGYVE